MYIYILINHTHVTGRICDQICDGIMSPEMAHVPFEATHTCVCTCVRWCVICGPQPHSSDVLGGFVSSCGLRAHERIANRDALPTTVRHANPITEPISITETIRS